MVGCRWVEMNTDAENVIVESLCSVRFTDITIIYAAPEYTHTQTNGELFTIHSSHIDEFYKYHAPARHTKLVEPKKFVALFLQLGPYRPH